jgi:hypothetical protein
MKEGVTFEVKEEKDPVIEPGFIKYAPSCNTTSFLWVSEGVGVAKKLEIFIQRYDIQPATREKKLTASHQNIYIQFPSHSSFGVM